MNKTVAGVVLALVSVGLIGGVLYTNRDDKAAQSSATSSADNSHFTEVHKDDGHHDKDLADEAPASANEITIKNYEFQPEKLTIKAGTTVKWTNQDTAKHDITPDSPSADFVASELLAKGESYSFTFAKAGTYTYFCSPHPYMKATIEVTE